MLGLNRLPNVGTKILSPNFCPICLRKPDEFLFLELNFQLSAGLLSVSGWEFAKPQISFFINPDIVSELALVGFKSRYREQTG